MDLIGMFSKWGSIIKPCRPPRYGPPLHRWSGGFFGPRQHGHGLPEGLMITVRGNRTEQAPAEGINHLSRKNIVSSHKVIKTIAEINERIKKGQAVVLNAEEMTEAVRRMGPEKAAREVDVVTTGTFSPMCSSGLLFNIGQPEPPKIRTTRVWMNDVPAYAGLAAVDAYLGATELPEDDPQRGNGGLYRGFQ